MISVALAKRSIEAGYEVGDRLASISSTSRAMAMRQQSRFT